MAKYNSIIKSYGLHWDKDAVEWGKENLLGYRRKKKEPNEHAKKTGIYILYLGYEMVYVGQAKNNLFSRLKSHTISKRKGERWDKFSWFEMQVTRSHHKNIIDTIEALLIDTCEPHLNYKRGTWGKAIRYFQSKENYQTDREKLDKIQRTLDEFVKKKELYYPKTPTPA
jgi:hypothetical protein